MIATIKPSAYVRLVAGVHTIGALALAVQPERNTGIAIAVVILVASALTLLLGANVIKKTELQP